jgi:hypothetical protein
MALVGVLSTQVWYDELCRGQDWPEELAEPRVHMTEPLTATQGAA